MHLFIFDDGRMEIRRCKNMARCQADKQFFVASDVFWTEQDLHFYLLISSQNIQIVI